MAQDTMKGTKTFQETIAQYLYKRVEQEPQMAVKLANPLKTMEQCCQFIINEVKKSGCCGFTDDEIYNLAIHYWDEEEIEVGEPINCQVVVNHVVELTEEEKAEAKRKAMDRLCNEQMELLRKASSPRKTSDNKEQNQTPSLFDDF